MTKYYSKAIAVFLLFFAITNPLRAQTPIPLAQEVKENFNAGGSGLALPANWKVSVAGGGATATWATGTASVTQAANSGSPATGGSYNWGTTAGTDRATGFLASPGYASPNAVMAYFRNASGAAITSLTISFHVERYRVNTSGFSLEFSSSEDGTAWTSRSAGNISSGLFAAGSPAFTFDTPATITKTVTLSGLNIASNADIYFRWVFTDAVAANAQGFGLDDVSVFAGAPAAVVSSTLKYILKTDTSPVGQANSGDELTYKTAIKNTGTGDAADVVLTEPAPTNTTFVGGSIKTSTMARDETFIVALDTPLSGGNVLSNDYGIPSPAVVSFGPTANPAATAAGGSGSSDNGGTVALNADGTFTYTPPAGFVGKDQFRYIAGNGNLPNNDAIVTISVGGVPVAMSDSYDVVGNVSISPNGAAGILANDTGGGLLITAVNGNASGIGAALVTGGGGNLTVNANGSFTYNPAPGFSGSDSFTYTIDNGFSAPATATATLNVTGVVWFVNNNAASNGDGRLNTPFKLITNVTSTAAGQTIFLYESATAYSGSINLLATQKLIGQDASQNLETITGLTPNATYSAQFPAMNSGNATNVLLTASNANIITLNTGNTIRGVTAGNAGTGKKITGSSFGTLTLGNASAPDVVLNGTGQALDLQTGTLAGGLTSLATTSSGGQGVLINSVAGTYNFGPTSVSGSTAQGILISGSSAIVPTFGITTVSAGTDGVSIQNNSGDVTFSSLGVTAANGVGLLGSNNTGQIIVTNNTSGISATGGAAISLSQASGTSTVNLNFSGLTSTGAVNGIHLNNIAGTIIGGGGSLVGSGTAFNVNGGSVSVTYSGNISQTNNADLVRVEGGHATGTITFGSGTLSATNGAGLQFNNADGIYNFNGTTTLNGGDAGIDLLNGTSGTFTFGTNTTITNPSGTAFNLSGATASNATVTYSGSITDNTGFVVDIDNHDANTITFQTGNITSSANGIRVQNSGAGTINFNNPSKSLTTGGNAAVTLTNNTGSTINFGTSGLVISTTSGAGFNATGGGTVSVTGTGNTIFSTTGAALNVNATTIGAGGLTFVSISANGASKGISLNGTGSGGLTVTGTGTTDGSGGTIQNNSTRGIELISAGNINLKNMNLISANNSADGGGTGACDDLVIGGCNAAIYLSSVSTVALDNIDLSGTMVENGITGLNVSNLTMNNCTINGAGNEAHESGMELQNLSGVCSITNTSITFSETNSLDILNTDANLTLTIDGSTFSDTQTVSSGGAANEHGEGGFQFRSFSNAAGIPVSNVKIKNSSFHRLRTQGIQAIAEDDSELNIDITNCNINSFDDIGAGIDINGNDMAEVNFNILNNPVLRSRGGSTVNITSFLDANVMGRVNNNPAITANGINGGGSGVRAVAQETSHLIIEVKSNNITMGDANNSSPIDMQARFQTARIDITLASNTIDADPTALAAINIIAGSSGSDETSPLVYANIISNNILAGGAPNVIRLRVSDLDGTTNPLMFLQGFVDGGSGLEDDAVATWNNNGNNPPATASTLAVSLSSSATGPAGGTALTPTNP
ncbi:Ig-like domain-containing protein [Dyadobacter sp. CY323]|uniref:beta strand repeat-containing protein n=1 Tax=Dyadobacter sp. CY323 TaxID=2907302 RepID=UPI001F226BDB|nr:Ig-like domain-containing protein [Dyadobacter sp. CY323]MCE6989746.1 Ig-like domain-containing protein [Dyadobacter sp. CY323]